MSNAHSVPLLMQQVPQVGAQVRIVVNDHDHWLVKRFVNYSQELWKVDRFRNYSPRPGGKRLLSNGPARIRRNDDRHGPRTQLLDLVIKRQTVHAGHFQIQQSHVVWVLLDQLQSRRSIVGGIHAVIQIREDVGQIPAGVDIVVNNQNRCFRGFHGWVLSSVAAAVNVTVNVLPRCGALTTCKLPLFLSKMARAMARPKPSPRALVEYKGSMIR